MHRLGYKSYGDDDNHYALFNEWHIGNFLKNRVYNFKYRFCKEGEFSDYKVLSYKTYVKRSINFLFRLTPLWRMSYQLIEIKAIKKAKPKSRHL